MPAPASRPAIDIVSIGWERIQLRLEARLTANGPLDPASLRLEGPDGAVRVPPAAASLTGDRLSVRINVMRGRGLQPLAPGPWRLVTTTAEGGARPAIPIRIEVPAAVDSERDSAAFRLRGGTYSVRPAVARDGSFRLWVQVVAEGGFDREAGLLARPRVRLVGPIRAARGMVFRLMLGAVRRVTGRSGRRILFTSDLRDGLEGNLRDVHDRMVERGFDRRYRLQTHFKASDSRRRGLRDLLRLSWRLAGASVIVIDDVHPVIYLIDVDPGVRIIQLWHASGAFKTVGYSRVGKPGGPDPFGRVHKNYTRAIVNSVQDIRFYAEAFGIPESRVTPTGIPRMDRFFDPRARAEGLAAARAAYPESEGRMTILFAPTFRGDGAGNATYDLDRLDFAALHAVAVEKDAVVIIKMHPFVQGPLDIPEAFRDRLLDGSAASIDVNDLLFAVDLLITDYSSIVFEFSTLGRPMLFFAYDLDEYIASRDFYEPYETFVPGRIVRTFAELLDAVRRDDYEADKVAEFAARHFAHHDAGSTDRVIDQLIVGPP